MEDIPIGGCVYLVEIFSTLLTKILLWRALLGHYSDASAVLPNFTDVALYEEPRSFVGEFQSREETAILSVFRVLGIVV